MSILSVETSRDVSSASTQSPGCLCHSTTVPSATDTPIWGIVTSTIVAGSILEELTAGLPYAIDGRQHHGLERRREGDRAVGRCDAHDRPVEVVEGVLGDERRTCAPAAHVSLASSTMTTFDVWRTASRIACVSSGTSERRSSTMIDAPAMSSVASSAVCTIWPYAMTTRSSPSRATRAVNGVSYEPRAPRP